MSMTEEVVAPLAEGFDTYYDNEIAPDLEAMESQRRAGARLFIGLILVAIVGGACFFFAGRMAAMIGLSSNKIQILGLLFVAGGIGGAIFIYKRVHGAFKEVLVGRTCTFLGLRFETKGFAFPFGRFIDAELLPRHDERKLEDRISGTHNEVAFELCEAKLDRVRNNSGGDDKNDDEDTTVFRGMLLRYSFAKPFNGRTLVTPDAMWLGNKLIGAGKTGERVTLEDVGFERQFEVYSTDQVEARYLLTPRFMERLVELASHFGNPKGLSVAFDDSDLLIAVRSTVNRFEGGSIFSSFVDRSRAHNLIEELSLIFTIIDVLNLEDRTGA